MAHTTHTPTATIHALIHTFESLSNLLASLSESQWKMQSQLPGWTVQDNVSHITGTERLQLGHIETTHVAVDLTNTHNPIGQMNEHHVDLRRSWLGAEVLAEYETIASERITQLLSADEAYWQQEVSTPMGPGTFASFLDIRLLDIWTHEQDIRRTVGLPGNRGTPEAVHTIQRLCNSLPIVVGKRAQTPEGETVVIEIVGDVQYIGAITVTNGRAQLSKEVPPNALCTITMDSDVFLQLATGRTTFNELASHITITGNQELATAVVTQFTVMI